MKTSILWPFLTQFIWGWEMFQAKVVEKSKHTFYVLELCFLKIVLFVRKKIVQPDRPQMTIWLMCISCCISKAANIHSEYVILLLFHRCSGCMNISQCYVIHTLPFFFTLPFITTQHFLTISCSEGTSEVNSKIVPNTSWKKPTSHVIHQNFMYVVSCV